MIPCIVWLAMHLHNSNHVINDALHVSMGIGEKDSEGVGWVKTDRATPVDR